MLRSFYDRDLASGTNPPTRTYDPAGRLWEFAAGTGATRYAYEDSDALTQQDQTGTLFVRYVQGPSVNEPLVRYTGTGATTRNWLAADERGSIIALSDDSGNVTVINRYDEYGIAGAGNASGIGYAGQRAGPPNDDYARYYRPSEGVFMQTDPIGPQDDANLYAYVLNDPVNLVDPTGMAATMPDLCKQAPQACVFVTAPANRCSAGWSCGSTFPQTDPGQIINRPEPSDPIEGGDIVIIAKRKPKPKPQQFTCAEALRQPGEIVTNYIGGGVVGAIGWTGAYGHWRNVSTGAHGDFKTFGFAAGLAAGASFSTQRWTSLNAFIGSSDSWTIAVSFNFGPFSGGGDFTHAWNELGSGQGPGVTLGSSGLPRWAVQGAWTDTAISNCRPK